MTEHMLVLLVCLAVIVVVAILLYVSGRSQASALAGICEARLALNQILANTNTIENSLQQQRHVLYDADKRISSVTKGVSKPTL